MTAVLVVLLDGPNRGDVLSIEEGIVRHGLVLPVLVEPWSVFSTTEPTAPAPYRMETVTYRVAFRLCNHVSSVAFNTPEYALTCAG